VQRFEAIGPPDPLTMFDHAYGERPAHLDAQRAAVAAHLGDGSPAAAPDAAPPSLPMRGQRTSLR
jgi:hypothetical protein